MGDPCQTQEDAVDDLESQIESLQSELETATPAEKQEIQKQIGKLQAQLAAAQAALAACKQAHAPLTCSWPAQFLLVGTQGGQERRITGSAAVVLKFAEDRATFTMQCPELTGSIEGYRIAVDLSTATGTVGSPDAHGFRDMRITANAHVTIAGPLINQTTDVSMTLTTDGTLSVQEFGENIEGSPINGNGFMTMVGEGTSGDQMLDIRLQGTVKPVPWQIS